MATKQDLKNLEIKMESKFDSLEARLSVKFEALEYKLLIRLRATVGAIVTLALSIFSYISRLH